jgi:hypothetical protein
MVRENPSLDGRGAKVKPRGRSGAAGREDPNRKRSRRAFQFFNRPRRPSNLLFKDYQKSGE